MSAAKKAETNNQQHFSADVSRLLDIVANALYTNHDVFLRELVSNSADACDRLRYQSIEKPELIADNPNFRIHIFKNTDTRTLTIFDNGIGMTAKELADHLGTIAKSGTAKIMEAAKKSDDPLSLIGQFGVGFYASYMVASHVKVISRKAGAKAVNVWSSDGATGFTVDKATADETALLDGDRGTAIILDIKDEGVEFLIDEKIKQTIETYSDHINVKIFLNTPQDTDNGQGNPINSASAIWTRSKSDITDEEYLSFYRHITHGFDEPLLTSHWRAEGKIEFSALLYVPMMRPWDLYDPSRKDAVKLYVNRVFISDGLDGLMYPWMRFVRGVIDSSDLPLNISRESLQFNPIISKIRTSVTKRILSDLDKLSHDDWPGFITFWGQFGAAIKEGLYDAAEHREALFKICRFYSTHDNGDKFTSLDEYVDRMGENQKEIYYITGENLDAIKNSPQIEGFKARGIEVLFFTDTIDDFWLQNVTSFKDKDFKSVTKGDIDLGDAPKNENDKDDEADKSDHKDLLERMKSILEDEVDSVRISKRLTDSPVCLVAPEGAVDMNMERVLKIHQNYQGQSKPVLEINAKHSLIKKLETLEPASENFSDATKLLLDQARIIQGEAIKDPSGYARRMANFMERGL
ncbi:MAG: molecular chaperone HtpG [Alphaproteobacteria bacterium]|nr:molecular chaperone HtpG [Alphaproteobacteria bacterium]